MATKSTPDGVDLKLSNYSTTAAMNGSIASANNATLATVAANYGLKTVVDQHSLDIAARITPLEVDTKVANALLGALQAREQRRLHLGAAGLQGGRQCADRVRPAVYRRHFLGGGLKDSSGPPKRGHHGGPGRRPPWQGGRQRAGLPALHGGRTGHATGGRHQNSQCPAPQRSLLAGTPASRRSKPPRPTRPLASYSETALQTALRRRPAPSRPRCYLLTSRRAVGRLPHSERAGHADAGRHHGRAAGLPDGPGPGRVQTNHLGAGGVPLSRRPGHGDGVKHRRRAAQLLHHRTSRRPPCQQARSHGGGLGPANSCALSGRRRGRPANSSPLSLSPPMSPVSNTSDTASVAGV